MIKNCWLMLLLVTGASGLRVDGALSLRRPSTFGTDRWRQSPLRFRVDRDEHTILDLDRAVDDGAFLSAAPHGANLMSASPPHRTVAMSESDVSLELALMLPIAAVTAGTGIMALCGFMGDAHLSLV